MMARVYVITETKEDTNKEVRIAVTAAFLTPLSIHFKNINNYYNILSSQFRHYSLLVTFPMCFSFPNHYIKCFFYQNGTM